MYLVAKRVGWKVALLIHDKRTLKECEALLAIDLKAECEEVGSMAEKSLAWSLVQKVDNFWKAVKGEIPGIRSTQTK